MLAALAGLTACERRQAPPAMPPVKVTVAQPQRLMATNWDQYPGHVEAVEAVEVRARVSGYLESIPFVDGTEVKAGDLLFVIDPRPYQAELDRAVAVRRQAETRLELARNDQGRAELLRGTKAISEEELDSRAKAAREADDALKAAQAAEAAATLNLNYTRITAPVSGRISRRLITVGNLVQANGTPVLATIVSMAPIYCYFDVQEEAFLLYRRCFQPEPGGKQLFPMPCELKLGSEEGFPHRGQVDFFDNQVDAGTGTLRMRGVFANEDRGLVPGLFATVRVPAGPAVEALVVPETAIMADQNYKFVYVVSEAGTADMRPIKIGRSHGPLRAVLEGLTPQDRVVTDGMVRLRSGAKVELLPGAGPATEPRRGKAEASPPRPAPTPARSGA
ncbi:MAG: efflux RND transporter periplasmic adaptor subunit [Verrucomicrobiota bacterium]|jgi:multidrug efflux system membrane fusion protein